MKVETLHYFTLRPTRPDERLGGCFLGAWKGGASGVLASSLIAGNQVLTKSGHATITSVKKQSGRQKVYNLEVRDLHNFLVGDFGVVVHNSCFKTYLNFFFGGSKINKINGKKWVDYAIKSGIPSVKELNQLEALGEKLNKRMLGLEKGIKNDDFPGIDGIIDGGRPLSLKVVTGDTKKLGLRLKQIATKANSLNEGKVLGYENFKGLLKNGIDGMLSTTKYNKSVVQNKWNSILANANIDTHLVKTIYIEAKDGWLIWTPMDGWKSF